MREACVKHAHSISYVQYLNKRHSGTSKQTRRSDKQAVKQEGASRSTSNSHTKMQRLDLEAKVKVDFKVKVKPACI